MVRSAMEEQRMPTAKRRRAKDGRKVSFASFGLLLWAKERGRPKIKLRTKRQTPNHERQVASVSPRRWRRQAGPVRTWSTVATAAKPHSAFVQRNVDAGGRGGVARTANASTPPLLCPAAKTARRVSTNWPFWRRTHPESAAPVRGERGAQP